MFWVVSLWVSLFFEHLPYFFPFYNKWMANTLYVINLVTVLVYIWIRSYFYCQNLLDVSQGVFVPQQWFNPLSEAYEQRTHLRLFLSCLDMN